MMERELRELESVLKAERKLFAEYLEKLTEQQKYLIENDLAGLRESIQKINIMAQEAMTLENGRKKVVARISEKLNIDKNDITLSKLLDRFEGHNFEELQRLRNAILDTHVKATAQRERNELLINQSMNMIGQTMDYINRKKNPKVVYDNPAKKNGCGAGKRALLTRTA